MTELLLDFVSVLDDSELVVNKEVGSVYDLAINGVGLKVYQGEKLDRDARHRRYTVPLDPDRLSTTDTPFSQNIQRYQFVSWDDFTGGAGQKHRDRPSTSPTKFFDSHGMDVFTTPGEITLLPDTERIHQDTVGDWVRVEQVDTALYIIERRDVYVKTTVASAPALIYTHPDDIVAVTNDGVDLYIAGSTGIFKGSNTNAFALWSAKDVRWIAWVAGGMVISKLGATSLTANEFWSIGVDGLYDTTGATPGDDSAALPLLTLPNGWTVTKAVFGGGFVWFCALAGTRSHVYRWRRGSSIEAPVPVWDLPDNELATTLFHYQGQVMVRASVIDENEFVPAPIPAIDDTIAARIYRCPVDQAGALVPFLLLEILEDDVNNTFGGWNALGRFMHFGWSGMSETGTESGVGIIDLATGGWSRHVVSDLPAQGNVGSIVEWRNRLYFSVDGQGVWGTVPEFVGKGYLDTDHSDSASALLKTMDDYRCIFEPLPAEASVEMKPSFDYGGSYLDRGFIENRAGAVQMVREEPRSVQSIGIRLVLIPNTARSAAPRVKLLQVRIHMQGLADQILEIPVDCTDRQHQPNRAASPTAKPGYGAETSRWLESLTQQLVSLQDVDFPWTGVTDIWQLVQAETSPIIEYDVKQGKNSVAAVTRVTLRRSLLDPSGAP